MYNIYNVEILTKFYEFIRKNEGNNKIRGVKQLPVNILPEPYLVLIKALLEVQFKPRQFTLKEIEGLIREVFNDEEVGNMYIPQWYKDKWFNGKSRLQSSKQ